MQIFNFPKVYSDLAISLLDDKNVDKVEIRPKSDYCNIKTTKEGDIVDLITSNRQELCSNNTNILYYIVCKDFDGSYKFFYHNKRQLIEILNLSEVKEKLDYILSLFNQKIIVHTNKTFEFDVNHIEITPELRNLVNDYLGAVINSLGE